MLLKMMLMLLICDRLSRGLFAYTHMLCVCVVIRYIIIFVSIHASSLLSAAAVVLMCIKRSMSMQLCIISACHKSKAHATFEPRVCMYHPIYVVLSYARNKGLGFDENWGCSTKECRF